MRDRAFLMWVKNHLVTVHRMSVGDPLVDRLGKIASATHVDDWTPAVLPAPKPANGYSAEGIILRSIAERLVYRFKESWNTEFVLRLMAIAAARSGETVRPLMVC